MKRGAKTLGSLDLGLENDRSLRGRIYAGSIAAFALVGAVGGWAAGAEISGAVIAMGQVQVDQDLRAIQHLDGGIVREIAVKKGDSIAANQLLFRLDSTQILAERRILESQITEMVAKEARLIAERDLLAAIPAPRDALNLDIAQSAAMKAEADLFVGNLRVRENEKNQLQLSISQLDHEMSGLKAQATANWNELSLVEAELKKVEDLHKRGLLDNSRVYGSTRERTRLIGEKGNIESNVARTTAKRSEQAVRLASVDERMRTDAQKELSELEPRISEFEQRHKAIVDKLSRTEIRAPLAGTINEISVNTIGGVITPAQKLLTIVPEESELQIQVRLLPSDIDQVFLGQHAKLRFSAFSARQTPELLGEIKFVSPATATDSTTGQTYYVAHVGVTEGESRKLGGKKLLPGMPVEAYIQTESRTALSYLAKPFVDQFAKAFREQ